MNVNTKTTPEGLIVIITDSDIIGKKFEEGNKQLDLTNKFYSGEEKSKEEIKIFKEAIPEHSRKHIDINLLKSLSIPKKSCKVNAFISFNDLGHVKDIPTFIQKYKKILNKNGKFCFYAKINFLNMSPNAIEMENKKEILNVFKKEKLTAQYIKRKKLFVTEIFIYGQNK